VELEAGRQALSGLWHAAFGGDDEEISKEKNVPAQNSEPLNSDGRGLGNPFKDKTPEEVEQMFKNKGFESKGPDPVNGKGGYRNPDTDRSYHLDPGGEYKKGNEPPHVDVNRLKPSKLPKKKYPL